MAVADLDEYRALLGSAPVNGFSTTSTTVLAGLLYSMWTRSLPIGDVPTAPVACNSSTVGALGQSSGSPFIIASRYNALNDGQMLVYDRLSHQGGLVANINTEQVTNLPTAALTRYTTGEGVMIALEVYTILGGTAVNVTANYTNQAGTPGRISTSTVIGSANYGRLYRMLLVPLAHGDTGVRSVESVTLDATTGATGEFGVTLIKPLYVIGMESTSGVASNGFVSGGNFGGIPQIVDGACIAFAAISGGLNAQGSGALVLGGA